MICDEDNVCEISTGAASKKSPGRAWILVTVFNRHENLPDFFKRLSQQDYPDFHVIVIDHGTVLLETEVPEFVTVLRSSPAKWWTGAINDGLRYVLSCADLKSNDYIIFLNEDVGFAPSLISKLVASSNRLGNAVVGAITLDGETDVILDADNKLSLWSGRHLCPLRGKTIKSAGEAPMQSDILKGRGVVYPIVVFQRLGLLYERLARRSDPEMAFRAKKAGFKVLVDPSIIVRSQLDRRTHLSGREVHLSDFLDFLFSKRSYANLPDAFYYYYRCLGPLRATYCFVVHSCYSAAYFAYKWTNCRLAHKRADRIPR